MSNSRQSAIRILSCIASAADYGAFPELGADVVAVLRSESRLQALDFWMRYPDYLANEVLNEYDKAPHPDLLKEVEAIFAAREPDLRLVPMVRYFFGAFEPLDDALAILRHRDLVRVRKVGVPGQRTQDNLFLLTEAGQRAFQSLSSLTGDLAWYEQRARLVARIANGAGGKALKDRQYLEKAYATTERGKLIAPIRAKVEARLAQVKENAK